MSTLWFCSADSTAELPGEEQARILRGRGSAESHPWRQARVRALIYKFVSTASFERAEVFPEEDQGLSLQQVAQPCWWPHPLGATSESPSSIKSREQSAASGQSTIPQ